MTAAPASEQRPAEPGGPGASAEELSPHPGHLGTAQEISGLEDTLSPKLAPKLQLKRWQEYSPSPPMHAPSQQLDRSCPAIPLAHGSALGSRMSHLGPHGPGRHLRDSPAAGRMSLAFRF